MIYFIEATGTDRVKIGFTESDPDARRKALQTGCPNQLNLLAAVHGSQEDEAELHRVFADLRETGEWFRLEGSLRLLVWLARNMMNPLANLSLRVKDLEESCRVYDTWMFPAGGERNEDGTVKFGLVPKEDLAATEDWLSSSQDAMESRVIDLEERTAHHRRADDDLTARADSAGYAIDSLVRSNLQAWDAIHNLQKTVLRHWSVSGRSLSADCRA